MEFRRRGRAAKKRQAQVQAETEAAYAERATKAKRLEEAERLAVAAAAARAQAEKDRFDALTPEQRADELILGVQGLRKAIGGKPVDPVEYLGQRAEASAARHEEASEPPAGAGIDLEAIGALLDEAASLQAAVKVTLQDVT